MTEIVLNLADEVATRLRDRAARQGKTLEQVVTEAVTADAREGKPPLPLGIGEFSSGDPSLAGRTREVIREAVEKGEWP